jgi:hypothetical protein
LLANGIDDPLPRLGNDRFIYFPFLLSKTYMALKNLHGLSLPEEYDSLIKSVYDGSLPEGLSAEMLTRLTREKADMMKEIYDGEINAVKRMVPGPGDFNFMFQEAANLDEDDPLVHKDLQALTRLGEPGIDLVCLRGTPDGLVVDTVEGCLPVDLQEPPGDEVVLAMLKQSVKVHNHQLVNLLSGCKSLPHYPPAWEKASMLRYHRLAIFEEGSCRIPGTPGIQLTLDSELGLIMQKE